MGQTDEYKNKSFIIILTKTSTYIKSHSGGATELLKKYHQIWNKISSNIKTEFESKSIYNKKFLKIKIKSHDNEAKEFHDQDIPKVGSNCTYLVVILIHFILKKADNYYVQVFFKKDKLKTILLKTQNSLLMTQLNLMSNKLSL